MHEDQLRGFEMALKAGFKPAITLIECESEADLIKKLSNCRFPRKKVVYESGHTFYWFFKDKKTKIEFLKSGLDKKYKAGERDHFLAGTFLGFPPKAVKHFTNIIHTKESVNNIYVNYGGIIFASYSHTLKNDIEWLLKHRPIPKMKGFKVKIGNRTLDVDSQFFNKEIKEFINNYTGEEIAI